MKEVCCHAVFTVLFVLLGIQGAYAELYDSLKVQNYFYQLFVEAGCGNDFTEHAAWIIVGNDGYTWIEWPAIKAKYKQVWRGPIPYAAVAIAHTHAPNDIAEPSPNDVLLAEKIKFPIYTVSQRGIWKVTPDGIVSRVQDYHWHKQIKTRCKFETTDGKREFKCGG